MRCRAHCGSDGERNCEALHVSTPLPNICCRKFIKPFRWRFETIRDVWISGNDPDLSSIGRIVASYFVQPSVVLARFQYTTGYGIAEDDVTEPISVLPTIRTSGN